MSEELTTESSFATVYPQVADRIAEQVPGLWIDLDQDQLENEADEYALPYDSGVLLISFDEVQWEDLAEGAQRGEAQIRFTLALQVVQDTYQHSGQRAAAMQKLQLLGQLHQALQHFSGPGFGALVRLSSRKESQSRPGLWVYSQVYKTRLQDEAGYAGRGERTAADLDTTPRPRGSAPAPEQFILV